MPKVTAEFFKVVRVDIRGEKREFPKVRDDGGLVGEFLKFLIDNKIDQCFMSTSGGGVCVGYFFEDAIPAIRAFLESKGVEVSPIYEGFEDETEVKSIDEVTLGIECPNCHKPSGSPCLSGHQETMLGFRFCKERVKRAQEIVDGPSQG